MTWLNRICAVLQWLSLAVIVAMLAIGLCDLGSSLIRYWAAS